MKSDNGRFADRAQYVITIDGMTCAACAVSVENALSKLPEVHDVTVRVDPGKATVTAVPSVSSETLKKAVAGAGFKVISIQRLLGKNGGKN